MIGNIVGVKNKVKRWEQGRVDVLLLCFESECKRNLGGCLVNYICKSNIHICKSDARVSAGEWEDEYAVEAEV